MTTLEVLLRGRARIEEGWCQGVSRIIGSNTAWCATGAVEDGMDERGALNARYSALDTLDAALPPLQEIRRGRGIGIPAWNDDPERTQADVLALYDRAIADERAKA